ncbi:MAG: LysE/ArgO family amino acid transporter [Symbiobacteriia bacterium]
MSPLFGNPALAASTTVTASAPGAASFLAGLLLGLAMILPLGPQNLFVLTQGLTGGTRRGLLAAITTGVCDTALILTGAAGLSALLAALPWLRLVLLALGAGFLLYLGADSLRQGAGDGGAGGSESGRGPTAPQAATATAAKSTVSIILAGVGVSWGNPHAILDTVAVLGAAIAAQGAASRIPFGAGVVAASWLFFVLLALVGSLFRRRITDRTQVWIRRASGLIMLVFALILGREALLGLLQ